MPFLTVATLLLVAEPLSSIVAHDRIAAATDTRVLASEWLAQHLPQGTRVAMVGTVFWGYGEPAAPPGIEMTRSALDAASLDATGARYVVTHDHPLFSSRVDPQALARLAPRLRLLAEFDPFTGPRDGRDLRAGRRVLHPDARLRRGVAPRPGRAHLRAAARHGSGAEAVALVTAT